MKQFKPSSWSIDNRTTIYIVTIIITLFGLYSYKNISKELFPDIVIPTIFVGTVYPGTSPEDMENLVTRHIEQEIKSISGLKKVTSNSIQDFSTVIAEFSTETSVEYARLKVKEAVDKAKAELPIDLPADPQVKEIDFAEFPILFINISGDYDLNQLKSFAEDAKDEIETLKEVTRVDIVGALEREIHIYLDMYKMQSAQVSLNDIERAVSSENVTVSGGNIDMNNMKRAVRVVGEFTSVDDLNNIVVRSLKGSPIYLRDIAEIKDTYKEQESFSRLNHQNVITLNVIKRSGENLINTVDKIKEKVVKMEGDVFPEDLNVVLTGDQSTMTRNTLQNLISSIILGFLLVTLVLMFFMGSTNAVFVGLAVPISMMLAFMVMPFIGFVFNMIVLFSFLLALGIIVDNAIVVIENTYRVSHEEKDLTMKQAAKKAAGEVFLPVLAGTLTTLAPFLPLAFWTGMVGKFMFFLPITLIITLIASLLVAFIINPVFAVSFMKSKEASDKGLSRKRLFQIGGVLLGLALLFHLAGSTIMGNILVFIVLIMVLNKYVFKSLVKKFQEGFLPRLSSSYQKFIGWGLQGYRPVGLIASGFGLLILLMFTMAIRSPRVTFFPEGDPAVVYAYVTLPIGTDQKVTDSVTKIVEDKIYRVLGDSNQAVESVIANVGVGAGDPREGDQTVTPHKGKVTVNFVEFKDRGGISTTDVLTQIRDNVKDIPGVEIKVDKAQNGPPTGKPVNIEVSAQDLDFLAKTADELIFYLDSIGIPGVEDLSSNFSNNKPELIVDVDRVRAAEMGLSTSQIGMTIRTALFGREISTYKDEDDEYPIQLKFQDDQRNIDDVMNALITFMDQNSGKVKQIPISAVADVSYGNAFGGISRKNMDRVITISSNVLEGYTPNQVVSDLEARLKDFPHDPNKVTIKMTGEQEEQAETMAFLSMAMLVSIGLIFIILVAQFNSFGKPMIILSSIVLSMVGVLAGFIIFDMTIAIVMNGIGIVALAGIVVNNGILLVEFTDTLKQRGMPIRKAIIEAGRIRLNPVLLTAISTMLGLLPLALGFNINFETLFSSLDPQIYWGGDSVAFWGPLSWTIIFGLGFATFLTLVLVPTMYLIMFRMWIKYHRLRHKWLYSN